MSVLVDMNTAVPTQGLIAGGCAIATTKTDETLSASIRVADGPGAPGSAMAEVLGL